MPNLTSALTIKLNDDLTAPAQRAAQAVKALGASGKDLDKLGGMSPALSRLAKQLEQLKTTSSAISSFREASLAREGAASSMRGARQDLARLTLDLDKARKAQEALKGVKTSDKNPTAKVDRTAAAADVRRLDGSVRSATEAALQARAAFTAQGRVVREMRATLAGAGVSLDGLRAKEQDLRRSIDDTTAALKRQERARDARETRRAFVQTRSGGGARLGSAAKRAAEGAEGGPGVGSAAILAGAVGVVPAVTGIAAYQASKAALKAQADYQHERVRFTVMNLTAAEIADAQRAAGSLSSQFPHFGPVEIMHQLRNAQSVVGSLEEAKHIMEPLLELRTVALGAHPDKKDQLNEDFDKLIKGLEIKGVTQDMDKFRRYIDGMAKAMNVFGDTIRATDYYEMFKYGRQATQNLSEEYTTMVAPTLAQELGGSSAGTAQAAFFRAIVGGKMSNLAVNELNKVGLVDPDKIIKTKTGNVKGVEPGGIKGSRLAAENPYQWVQQFLLPALKEKGITDEHEIQERIARVFSNQVAAQLVSLFATQQTRIEKDKRLVQNAQGTSAAKVFATQEPRVALMGIIEQTKRFATVVNVMEGAASAMSTVAKGISVVSDAIQAAKDHNAERVKAEAEGRDSPGLPRPAIDKLNKVFGSPDDMTRAGGEAISWLNSHVAPGAVRARQDKAARDAIDTRLGKMDAEIAAARERQARDERNIAPRSSAVGGSLFRRHQAKIDALEAKRSGLAGSVEARDKANLDLVEAEKQQEAIRRLRIAQKQGASAITPGHGGFGIGGPVAPGEQPEWNQQTANVPLPPPRPQPQARPAMEVPKSFGTIQEILDGAQEATQALDKLGGTNAAPKVDAASIGAAKEAASATGQALKDLGQVSVRPTVDTSGIDAYNAKVREGISLTGQLGAASGGLPGAGVGAGSSSGRVGRGLRQNHSAG